MNQDIVEPLGKVESILGVVKENDRKISEDLGKLIGFVNVQVFRGKDQVKSEEFTVPVYEKWQKNLLTNVGRDFLHNQGYINTSAGTRGAGFIGLTTDATTPSASDTALASELTTNGVARADASTKTHTTGTNVSTIQNTFTATGTVTAIAKAALFNAAGPPVNGTMVHEALFSSTVTLASGDSIAVTWTINLG